MVPLLLLIGVVVVVVVVVLRLERWYRLFSFPSVSSKAAVALAEEGVAIGLRLRLLPTVRLVPVFVVAFEGRLSGVIKHDELSVARTILAWGSRQVRLRCSPSCMYLIMHSMLQ